MSNSGAKLKKSSIVKHSDFSEEYVGKNVRITLHNGRVIHGKLIEARRFWVKVSTNDGIIHYINKAWIMYVQPLR